MAKLIKTEKFSFLLVCSCYLRNTFNKQLRGQQIHLVLVLSWVKTISAQFNLATEKALLKKGIFQKQALNEKVNKMYRNTTKEIYCKSNLCKFDWSITQKSQLKKKKIKGQISYQFRHWYSFFLKTATKLYIQVFEHFFGLVITHNSLNSWITVSLRYCSTYRICCFL